MALACCPWCGCAPIVDTWQPKSGGITYFGRCYSPVCKLTGPERATEHEAVAAWNNWLVIAQRVLSEGRDGKDRAVTGTPGAS